MHFYTLQCISLEIKGFSTLAESLGAFVAGEVINDYKCT
jgi:hypothetical protein